jgi:two-component system response regulator HydG
LVSLLRARPDVRVVAASSKELEAECAAQRFRRDLLSLLGVFRAELPPLRLRGGDVLLLAEHFLHEDAHAHVVSISREAERHLAEYDWPGNVAELRSSIRQAIAATSTAELQPRDLPAAIRNGAVALTAATEHMSSLVPLAAVERRYVSRVLAAVEGNKSVAAKILRIDRKTLARKMD